LARRAAAAGARDGEEGQGDGEGYERAGDHFVSARLVRATHAQTNALTTHQATSASFPNGPVLSPSTATDVMYAAVPTATPATTGRRLLAPKKSAVSANGTSPLASGSQRWSEAPTKRSMSARGRASASTATCTRGRIHGAKKKSPGPVARAASRKPGLQGLV